MFLYPILYTNTVVGSWLNNNLNVYAIWVGAGIHEVAQVAAAGDALGVAGAALSIKSIRVFMIGPMILIAAYINSRRDNSNNKVKNKFTLPAYGVVFVILSLASALLDASASQLAILSFNWPYVKSVLSDTVLKFLLTLSFSGVGSKIRLRDISKLGMRAFLFGALIAMFSSVLTLSIAILFSDFVPV
jgi:uncharacterized membrane protein YadS